MGRIFAPIASLFRNHKLKLVGVLLFAVVYCVLYFPPGDLSDIVSDKVSRLTGIYTQFDGLGITFNPLPGVHADNVVVEPPDVPGIKAASADVFVSFLSAILGKVDANATLSGLFKGDVNVTYSDGDKLKSGDRVKNIVVTTSKVDLGDVSEYMRSANMSGLAMKGALDLNSNLRIDPSFGEQPSGTVGVTINSFNLPGQKLATQMGDVDAPAVNLGKLAVQAKIGEGQIDLQDVSFGGTKDGISGKVKGTLGFLFRRGGNPTLTNYKLGVDLTIPKVFFANNPTFGLASGIIDGMIGRYKKETPNDIKYSFMTNGTPNGMPNFADKQ